MHPTSQLLRVQLTHPRAWHLAIRTYALAQQALALRHQRPHAHDRELGPPALDVCWNDAVNEHARDGKVLARTLLFLPRLALQALHALAMRDPNRDARVLCQTTPVHWIDSLEPGQEGREVGFFERDVEVSGAKVIATSLRRESGVGTQEGGDGFARMGGVRAEVETPDEGRCEAVFVDNITQFAGEGEEASPGAAGSLGVRGGAGVS